MLCLKPFRQGVTEFGCGQCLPCRINRRRLWTSRLMLESFAHSQSLFVTLTYRPESLPERWTLVPRHAQLFLKSLRQFALPGKVRYYLVGEYGEKSLRPHYHVVLYGSTLSREMIEKSWPHGFVHIGTLSVQAAHYTVGYVTKSMTKSDDERLEGRYPEFARMSLRPGIGAAAGPQFARMLESHAGVMFQIAKGDVPDQWRMDGKIYPLGRYIRRQVRVALGWEAGEPPRVSATRKLREIMEASAELVSKRDAEREVSRYKAASRQTFNRAKRTI